MLFEGFNSMKSKSHSDLQDLEMVQECDVRNKFLKNVYAE